ncbi:MAG: endo-1,4-beta-xylanase [Spirochaetales bacterium]|nr:endo-1,4-beta-xylanase [Spirochaetales bacterium]
MTKRRLLRLAAYAVCGLLVGASLVGTTNAGPAYADDGKTPAGRPLRELAAKRGILIGAAIDPWRIDQPDLAALIAREFDSIIAENEMKCAMIARDPEKYDFGLADRLVAFVEKNKMKMRGHTLVWHQSVPDWLSRSGWNKEQALDWLHTYITTVVSHFKGKIYCRDVVNEVFEPNGKFTGKYKSYWYKTCGEEYIEKAFVWAREDDPDAKLYINDVSCEIANRQSNAIHEWIKAARTRGVPVDGIGFQAHLAEETKIDYDKIRANFNRFKDLGLELQITEMDVRIDGPPTPEKLAHQASICREYLKIAIEFGMPAFTVWGVSDKDSWVPGAFRGYCAALLFDKELKPKPAYYAHREELAAAPATGKQ